MYFLQLLNKCTSEAKKLSVKAKVLDLLALMNWQELFKPTENLFFWMTLKTSKHFRASFLYN